MSSVHTQGVTWLFVSLLPAICVSPSPSSGASRVWNWWHFPQTFLTQCYQTRWCTSSFILFVEEWKYFSFENLILMWLKKKCKQHKIIHGKDVVFDLNSRKAASTHLGGWVLNKHMSPTYPKERQNDTVQSSHLTLLKAPQVLSNTPLCSAIGSHLGAWYLWSYAWDLLWDILRFGFLYSFKALHKCH